MIRRAASLWSIIGTVLQQQMRFQLSSASHKPHIPLPISLLPRDVRRSCIWKNTSPVCKKVCEMHNHHRSLRLIIQYIFFSHCLFPAKASPCIPGWQCTIYMMYGMASYFCYYLYTSFVHLKFQLNL